MCEKKVFWFEIQGNNFAEVTKNVDDCLMRKFEGLDGKIDAMNRCHDEICQNFRRRRRWKIKHWMKWKPKMKMFKAKRRRKTLLNSLRLWWKNTSKIQRRRMWKMKTSKIQRPKNMEKIRRVDISHATFALLWPLWRKETVETFSWNDTR